MDDIGVAAHTAPELIENLDLGFKQNQKGCLKLSIENCQFGNHSIELLGKTISTAGVLTIKEQITKFVKILKLPISVRTLQ